MKQPYRIDERPYNYAAAMKKLGRTIRFNEATLEELIEEERLKFFDGLSEKTVRFIWADVKNYKLYDPNETRPYNHKDK